MSAAGPSILGLRQPLATPRASVGEAAGTEWHGLGLAMEPQRNTEWCWAAVSASIARFYETQSSWTQCAIVNLELGQTVCCAEGSASTCNRPFVLEAALALVDHLGRDFAGPLAFADITAEIDAGRPIGVCIDWTGGGGHFVSIDGYSREDEMVEVRDPMFGASRMPVSSFPGRYQGGGTWGWTYLTRPAARPSELH